MQRVVMKRSAISFCFCLFGFFALREKTPNCRYDAYPTATPPPPLPRIVPRFGGQHEAHLPLRQLSWGLGHRRACHVRHDAAHPIGGGDDQHGSSCFDGLIHPCRRSQGANMFCLPPPPSLPPSPPLPSPPLPSPSEQFFIRALV